jgi:hypothetical protein
MKKQYNTPSLTIHGSVEAITEFAGSGSRRDFLFFNGQAVTTNNPVTGQPIVTRGNKDAFIDSADNIQPLP